MIKISDLNFSYKTYSKKQGLKGSIRDFFKREVKEKIAIENIDLSIEQGEIIGLLGKNGAGKTTLIKLLVGLIYPKSGAINILGHNPYKKEKTFLKEVGLVLGQKSQLIWDLPPSETLFMLKEIYEVKDSDFEKRKNELINMFDVEDKYDIPVRKLSLGERMKFEIIASLIHQPKLLFLDEPTIGLDLNTQNKIHVLLKEINKKYDTTIILTSHYMKDIEVLANRIVILDEGKKCCDMSLQSLLNSYNEEEIIVLEVDHPIDISKLNKNVRNVDDLTFEIHLNGLSPTELIREIVTLYDNVQSVSLKKVPLEDVVIEVFSNGIKEVS